MVTAVKLLETSDVGIEYIGNVKCPQVATAEVLPAWADLPVIQHPLEKLTHSLCLRIHDTRLQVLRNCYFHEYLDKFGAIYAILRLAFQWLLAHGREGASQGRLFEFVVQKPEVFAESLQVNQSQIRIVADASILEEEQLQTAKILED